MRKRCSLWEGKSYLSFSANGHWFTEGLSQRKCRCGEKKKDNVNVKSDDGGNREEGKSSGTRSQCWLKFVKLRHLEKWKKNGSSLITFIRHEFS
jgi:hypothetical protein